MVLANGATTVSGYGWNLPIFLKDMPGEAHRRRGRGQGVPAHPPRQFIYISCDRGLSLVIRRQALGNKHLSLTNKFNHLKPKQHEKETALFNGPPRKQHDGVGVVGLRYIK